jgi:predicted TIM-barrel fold metal-dependent hydrolase
VPVTVAAHPLLPCAACDCHVHVVGDALTYPMLEKRQYTSGPASVQDLRQHMARIGVQRTVIVQPSFYGTDNSCMLDSLRQLDGAGRGVAVVDQDASDAHLSGLHAQGVRGLRLNVESSGMNDAQTVSTALMYWADRLALLQWHIQIYASLDALMAIYPVLKSLSVPIVLDHFAMVQSTTALDDARFHAIQSLVQSGRVYVKLSASYRIQAFAHEAPDAVAHIAQRYIQANPERVLWGSDWPHTNREPGKSAHEVSAYRSVGRDVLLGGLHAWLPTEAFCQRVLVDNPAQLYGF